MRKWLSNGPEINDSYSVKDKTKFAVHQNENQKLQGIFFFFSIFSHINWLLRFTNHSDRMNHLYLVRDINFVNSPIHDFFY